MFETGACDRGFNGFCGQTLRIQVVLIYGVWFWERLAHAAQTFQNPLIKEYTLNHIRDPIII